MEDNQGSWLVRVDGTGVPVSSKGYLGTQDNKLTDVVAMPTGVAAFDQTETKDKALDTFGDISVVRANVDGMVHFDPASGSDAFDARRPLGAGHHARRHRTHADAERPGP